MEKQVIVRDTRRKQMFQVDDEYLNGYARLCGLAATGVYLSLCRHANREQECWPSMELIAKELAITPRTVVTAIKRLELWGIVEVERSKNKETNRQNVNVYTLTDKTFWKKKPGEIISYGKPGENNDKKPGEIISLEGHTQEEGHTQGKSVAKAPSPSQVATQFFNGKNQEEAIRFLKKVGLSEIDAKNEMQRFINYWTEPSLNGKKVRWQLEKTFELRRRLATWAERSNRYISTTKEREKVKVCDSCFVNPCVCR